MQIKSGAETKRVEVADALGHSLDTHLLSYARFNTRELAKSFDQHPAKTNKNTGFNRMAFYENMR